MPIRELSLELVHDIVESYGQITKLNLSTNEISRVENLELLTCLTSLDLFCNHLGSAPGGLEGLSPLTRLKDLDISENAITSLEPLSSAPASLVRLNVANNSVADAGQVSYLASLTALAELVLAGNPMTADEGYRGRTLTTLPSLAALDHTPRADPRDPHDANADGEGLQPRPAHTVSTGTDTSSRGDSLERQAAANPSHNPPPPPPPHTSGPAPDSAVPQIRDDASDPAAGGAGVEVTPCQGGGVERQGRPDNRSPETGSALPLPVPVTGSSGAFSSVSVPAAAGVLEFTNAEELLPPSQGGGGVGGGEVFDEGGPAASSAVSERSEEAPGGGVLEASGGVGSPSLRGGVALRPAAAAAAAAAPRAVPGATRAEPASLGGGDSLSGSNAPVEATTGGAPEKRPPGTVVAAAAAAAPGAAPGRFSAELAVDAPSSGGRSVANAAATKPLAAESDASIREATATMPPEREGEGEGGRDPQPRSDSGLPASLTLVEPAVAAATTTTTKVAVGSRARALAVSSPFCSGGDHGIDDDRNAREGGERRVPGGAFLFPAHLAGGRSNWDSTLEGQRLEAEGFFHDEEAGVGDSSGARTFGVRAESGRMVEGSYGAPSGDRRQVVLQAAAAAAVVVAPTTLSNAASVQSDRDKTVGLENRSDLFGTRRSSLNGVAEAKHDNRPRTAYPTTGQYSGAGLARSDPLWSGKGRVEAPDLTLHGAPQEAGTAVGSSAGSRASRPAPGRRVERWRGEGEGQVVVVGRGEWEALRQENDGLRRQAALSEKRCAALVEMQRLADRALSGAHAPLLSSSYSCSNRVPVTVAAPKTRHRRRKRSTGAFSLSSSSSSSSSAEDSENNPREQPGEAGEDGEDEEASAGEQAGVAKLLAAWRAEVLKLLLQRGAYAEVAAAESREARRQVAEEKHARGQAETEAESLTQRALAAEAEAELSGIKLARAFEELRVDRAGRFAAEASSLGYSAAVRGLREWAHGFVGRASEGFFEREAMLARGVAKLEAFSERLGQAAGRMELLGTLLRHKEVQLRNSRAALAADRRVWLLERRDREIAALSKASVDRPPPAAPARQQSSAHLLCGGGGGVRDPSPRIGAGGLKPGSGGGNTGECGVVAEVGAAAAVAMQRPLLEGLRPECEAVMRALFCRVDRLGTGAVRARRLLEVLRSDCGVSEVMEAAVGKSHWRAALDSMETTLCPPLAEARVPTGGGGSGVNGGASGGGRDSYESGAAVPRVERDVTWGEFLLFFLPSAGSAEDAYNAGLVSRAGGNGGCGPGFPAAASAPRQGPNGFGAVSEDAAAMLQMVVPPHWTAVAGAPSGEGGREAGDSAGRNGGGGGSGAAPGRGLAALSVGQLRREVTRLAKERAYLLALVRDDGRLGRRRAEAVHDQYRHELRALHAEKGELERSLEDSSRRTEAELERGAALREELSSSREEMAKVEQECKRRLDAAVQEKAAALAESSREASRAATTARERISRLEAEHSLALRENGKVLVRQRALERELARIKSSMHAETALEKEALEERLRAGEAKLATARRERNALLAALRDLQRRGRSDSDLVSPLPPTELGSSRGGGGMTLDDLGGVNGDGGASGGGSGSGGGGGGRAAGAGEVAQEEMPPADAALAAVGRGAGAETGSREAAPEVAGSGGAKGLLMCGGEEIDDAVSELSPKGQRREGAWQGAEVDEVGGGGSARAASLSARLELLALQTQQLLEDGSDTSYSSSSSDGDSG